MPERDGNPSWGCRLNIHGRFHAEAFFSLLASCDPSLTHWFKKGRTLEEALTHRFEPNAASLAKVFNQQAREEGRFATDGFSLSGWNGATHEVQVEPVEDKGTPTPPMWRWPSMSPNALPGPVSSPHFAPGGNDALHRLGHGQGSPCSRRPAIPSAAR
ncbi:Imm52 family immunity protein [Archangium lipolyticum]|uniref:Imm52 family immunity protein n=1 Tax=Archangium lipolyticum TaxID=2970465 RepID=UPI003898EDD0